MWKKKQQRGGKTSNCSRTISLLVRSFHLSGERPFVFLLFFILIFFLYFPWDSFFIIRHIETIFPSCNWPFKVMVPNDPLLDYSQNLQSYCPCVRKACYRYSSETMTYRNSELLPMPSVHLEGSSIYIYRKDLSAPSSSYCPWKYLKW